MNNITLLCRDDFLETSEVTDKDFLSVYNLEKYQLDAMKKYGLKKGYFKYKSYKYQLCRDGVRLQGTDVSDIIKLPESLIDGRKIKYSFTDVFLADYIPPKNKYEIFLEIYGEKMGLDDFMRRTGISRNTITRKVSRAKSFVINGVPVKMTYVLKPISKFWVLNTISKYKSTGQYFSNVLKKTKIPMNKLKFVESSKRDFVFMHFVIGLEE